MNTNSSNIVNHVKEYAAIYTFMIILFLTGIIFGAILVNSMSFIQKQDLFFYLDQFFLQISNDNSINQKVILKESFFYHAKFLLLIFILGLSVIGLPVVWILLFTKGLVVGFTVGFMVSQLGFNGFLLSAVSIAPQNLIIIPVYILAGSLSMIFTLTLLNKLFTRRISDPILQPFVSYATAFTALIVVSLLGALMEAFVANEALEMMIQSFYSESELS